MSDLPRRRPAAPPAIPSWEGSRGGYLPLIVPSRLGVTEAVFLSSWLWGMALHYDPEAGYYPCRLSSSDCAGCAKYHQLPRWMGHADALLIANGMRGTLVLTAEAWMSCPALVKLQGNLRGQAVRLKRPNTRKNGRVVAALMAEYRPDQLPDPLDIRPRLCRHWGLEPDWWEWQIGTDPAGLACPGAHVPLPPDTKKGD